jgi:hypothetical protein
VASARANYVSELITRLQAAELAGQRSQQLTNLVWQERFLDQARKKGVDGLVTLSVGKTLDRTD